MAEGPTEYVKRHVPDRTPGTPAELWSAFADAAGYEPKGTGERSAWTKIIDQWAKDGFTTTEIRRAVAGFKGAHKGAPIHIWDVNHGISAYIALMTPRDSHLGLAASPGTTSTYGVIEPTGDEVGPPVETMEQFGGSE